MVKMQQTPPESEYWALPMQSRLVDVVSNHSRGLDSLGPGQTLILAHDDNLEFIMQLPHVECVTPCQLPADLEQKWRLLGNETAVAVLCASKSDIMRTAERFVSCIGCRRSVEQMLLRLSQTKELLLSPVKVNRDQSVKLEGVSKGQVAAMFRDGHARLSSVDGQPAGRRSKRCSMHTLDAHRPRSAVNWLETWLQLDPKCQDEVLVTSEEDLRQVMTKYVEKHRFCCECKRKVRSALDVLMTGQPPEQEQDLKEFKPELFDGLEGCSTSQHVVIDRDVTFLAQLINRAETLDNSTAERHAKTFDIAQEELLACLGKHFVDRLNRLSLQMQSVERTWRLLLNLSFEAIRNSFEVAVDKRRDVSALERFLIEETEADAEELQRQERKREKKRNKRKNKKQKRGEQENSDASACAAGRCQHTVLAAGAALDEEDDEEAGSFSSGASSPTFSVPTLTATEPCPAPTECTQAKHRSPSASTCNDANASKNCHHSQTCSKGSSCPYFDTDAELRLLSSMGWDCCESDMLESDEFALTEEEIRTAKASLRALQHGSCRRPLGNRLTTNIRVNIR